MILQATDIIKSFYQGKTEILVLKGLNLELNRGETVAILGKSGSGKSTLLSLLAGLDNPDSGKLKLLNQDLYQMSEDAITRFRSLHMGIIFQNFHLIPHLSALENIALPMEIRNMAHSEARAMDLLSKVGLNDRSNHRPSQLSGGEQQRVAVARALSSSPDLILADEPSGSLDENTGEEITNLLFNLVDHEQTSMILVTHDKDLARRCTRRLTLIHGVLSDAD